MGSPTAKWKIPGLGSDVEAKIHITHAATGVAHARTVVVDDVNSQQAVAVHIIENTMFNGFLCKWRQNMNKNHKKLREKLREKNETKFMQIKHTAQKKKIDFNLKKNNEKISRKFKNL